MAGDINAVGRQQALLTLALRAGFKAFAVVLRAGVTVVLQQRDGVVDLFLHGERALADAAAAQVKARLLEEVLLLPHRQLVLLRQANGDRRADLLAAAAEDAAPEVKLPGQLAGFEIRFYR